MTIVLSEKISYPLIDRIKRGAQAGPQFEYGSAIIEVFQPILHHTESLIKPLVESDPEVTLLWCIYENKY